MKKIKKCSCCMKTLIRGYTITEDKNALTRVTVDWMEANYCPVCGKKLKKGNK